MTLRLHHVPFSRSFRVLWMLEELGLKAEIVTHSIRQGSLRAADVQAISPAGRAPAIEIGDLSMIESGAILEYLAETHPEAGLQVAAGAQERARYLQFMHFAETQASLIEQLNLQHLFLRDQTMQSPTVIKLNTRRLEVTLAAFEAMLGEGVYLLSTGFSAADIMMGFNLAAAPYYVDLSAYPKLEAYRKRLEARPAYQAARRKDGEQEFYTQDFYPIPEEG